MTRAMIIAAALVLVTSVGADPLPKPKPVGPGGSCPHGYFTSGSFCVPSQGAQDAVPKPPTIGASAGKYRANWASRMDSNSSTARRHSNSSSPRFRRCVAACRQDRAQGLSATGRRRKSPGADCCAIGSSHTPASMSQVSWNQWFDAEVPLARMSPSSPR